MFRERQQILICLTAVLMVAGFVILRYLPLRERIKAVEQTRTERKLAVKEARHHSRELPTIKNELTKLQTAVGDYQQLVPTDRDIGAFLRQIADLMKQHDLKGQQIQPGLEIKTGELNCIPVSMQCRGSLGQLFAFFKSLQQMDRLIRIEQVHLDNNSDFSGELNMQTRGVIYYRPVFEQG